MAHIILYRDEFDCDVWDTYCEICNEHPSAISITITFDEFKDVKAEYEEDQEIVNNTDADIEEICEYCGHVNEIKWDGESKTVICEECGEEILLCSLCDMDECNCDECPYM